MQHEQRIIAAKNGDDESFYSLIVENKEKLYRVAYSYLKNESDALEAIQEVTCRAYVQIRKLKEPNYFTTWLIRIMMNYCNDELKKRSRTVTQEFNLENSTTLQSNEEVINFDRIGIDWALDRIDPQLREIVELKYFHDLTITEIAHSLKRPEGTIKTWLHKGLKGLRGFIQKEGEADV